MSQGFEVAELPVEEDRNQEFSVYQLIPPIQENFNQEP